MITALSVVVLKQVPLECESIAQNVGYALHQRHLRSHHRHVTSHPLSELVDTVIQQETLYTIVRADNVGQVGPVSRTSSLPPDESAAEVALVLPGAVFRLCCAAGGPCFHRCRPRVKPWPQSPFQACHEPALWPRCGCTMVLGWRGRHGACALSTA
jgi:hypothetical protein